MAAEVTIIIPNYKTPELTRLCLRSLRKYTDLAKARILVIDNDSADDSLEYLRRLKWITLLERKTHNESGPAMHSKALDEAFEHVDTPYVLVIHTDTIVLRDDWLDFLLERVKADENIAGVGSWKLESVSPVKLFFKRIETAVRRLMGRKILDREHYFRSHCALYKSSAVRETRGFGDGDSAGVSMFRILREKNYALPFISSEDLCRYMAHLNHATMIINPQGEGGHKTSKESARTKLRGQIARFAAILEDSSLDQ